MAKKRILILNIKNRWGKGVKREMIGDEIPGKCPC